MVNTNRCCRLALQTLVGAIFGLSIGALLMPAALAGSPGGWSGYAAAQITSGGPWGGGYVQTQVINLTDGVQGSYGNEELWVVGLGGSTSNYLEVGYTINNTGCDYNSSLEWFTDSVNQGVQIFTLCGNAPESLTVGTYYLLEIQQVATDTWDAYINNNLYYEYGNMPGNQNTEAQVGLEYYESDYLSFSGQANFAGMEVRNTSCCTWYYWPSGSTMAYPTTDPPFTWTWTQYFSNGYNKYIEP